MKITVGQKNIKKALTLVERVVSRNTTLPILNNILLKTENGRLKVAATNLEIGVTVFIGAKVEEGGEVAVPGKIFSEFIANIQDETLSLTVKNNSIFIQSENYTTQILGCDSKEYPIIPKIKEDPICSLPGDVLKYACSAVIDSVAASEARPELAGVYIQCKGAQGVVFASTDGFHLTEKTIPIKTTKQANLILPRTTVTELMRIGGEIDEVLDIEVGDNQISFSSNDFELISRLIDGKYPDYARLIPDKFISKILVEKDVLEKNTRLAGLFSSSISDVRLQASEKSLIIKAKNSDKGEIQAETKVLLKNEGFEIAVNFHYLLDGLKIFNTDRVVIEFTGQGSPLFFGRVMRVEIRYI